MSKGGYSKATRTCRGTDSKLESNERKQHCIVGWPWPCSVQPWPCSVGLGLERSYLANITSLLLVSSREWYRCLDASTADIFVLPAPTSDDLQWPQCTQQHTHYNITSLQSNTRLPDPGVPSQAQRTIHQLSLNRLSSMAFYWAFIGQITSPVCAHCGNG